MKSFAFLHTGEDFKFVSSKGQKERKSPHFDVNAQSDRNKDCRNEKKLLWKKRTQIAQRITLSASFRKEQILLWSLMSKIL